MAMSSAEKMRRLRERGADIGPISDIVDLDRRVSCTKDFRLFCEQYLPETFNMAWGDFHFVAIQKIEDAILHDVNFALALPRGSGKSSLCKAATLWAALYGHADYTYFIGANSGKAQDALDQVGAWLTYVPELLDDFPEVAIPFAALQGVSQRAKSQKSDGIQTHIEYTKSRLIFPKTRYPKNHPDFDIKNPDKLNPASGRVIAGSGLEANGLRGSAMADADGGINRPTLCIVDDPATDASAKSPTQVEKHLELVRSAIANMAPPDQAMRILVPCTIIARNDLASQLVDPKQNPDFRGQHTKLIDSFPTEDAMELWDAYMKIRNECLGTEGKLDLTEANKFYEENQEALEAGCVHNWPERHTVNDPCGSAIHNAILMYLTDKSAFMSEMMNEPLLDDDGYLPTVDEIKNKQADTVRCVIPVDAAHLTAGIDVHKNLLYWSVMAHTDSFGSTVIDYGVFPEQAKRTFKHESPKKTLAHLYPHLSSEQELIYEGLTEVTNMLDSMGYANQSGNEMPITKILIDSGYQTDTVKRFCRYNNKGIISPSQGIGKRAGQIPLSESKAKDIVIRGNEWLIKAGDGVRGVQQVSFDANYWKSFYCDRLIQGTGADSALHLYADDPKHHDHFAHHLRSESYDWVTSDGTGRRVREWRIGAFKSNHWLDTVVLGLVGASILGCKIPGEDGSEKMKKTVKIKRKPFKK